MELNGVIFDMDGVLVNTESHHLVIEGRIFHELGIDISEEERKPFVGMASDELWGAVINQYELDHSPYELLGLNNQRILEYFSKEAIIEPIPGVQPVLEWISKMEIPLAVASSSSAEVIDFLLGKTGLDRYFDIRVGGQTVEKSKPEPYIYFYTAEILGVDPEECMVVEDSTNGIAAAKAAGMYCIAYQGTGYHEQDQSRADKVINHFDELIPLLENSIGG